MCLSCNYGCVRSTSEAVAGEACRQGVFASCVMSVCMIACLHEKLADRAGLHGCVVAPSPFEFVRTFERGLRSKVLTNSKAFSLPLVNRATPSASAHVAEESGGYTYVTVLGGSDVGSSHSHTSDPGAVLGVIALYRSLVRVEAAYPLLCLCISVSDSVKQRLVTEGIEVREVEPLERDRVGAFAKVQVLKLIEYRRVLFLDYDTIVIKNIDHLSNLRACDFAFAPDIGVDVSAARRVTPGRLCHMHVHMPTYAYARGHMRKCVAHAHAHARVHAHTRRHAGTQTRTRRMRIHIHMGMHAARHLAQVQSATGLSSALQDVSHQRGRVCAHAPSHDPRVDPASQGYV
jgi:hypothetical protein